VPRQPRLFVAGGFYHVVLRGNNRGDIFFEDDDRETWQSLLQKGLERYGHRLHAYCWMTNHVHLLLQAGAVPLSTFLGSLSSTYARSVNARDGRVGHLFERRYRASLVQQDQYLLEVVRYIHLNPVRANIVESPNDYPWSSHHTYMGRLESPWVTTGFILNCFAATIYEARAAYLDFIGADEPSSSMPDLDKLSRISSSDDQLIGDDAWKSEILSRKTSSHPATGLDELVERVCAEYEVTEVQLQSRSRRRLYSAIRAEIALAAVDQGIATLAEVARRFGRAHSGLSRAVNRLRDERQ
jgi:REP element-mobilizing transposase RayT